MYAQNSTLPVYSVDSLHGFQLLSQQPKLKYYQGRNFALHKRRAIYFEVPKVACSSMILKCADWIDLEIDRKRIHSKENKAIIPKVELNLLDTEYKNYFKFTFVRNPWDRLVSCYKDKVRSDANFNNSIYKNGVHTSFIKYNLFTAGMNFEDFVEAVCNIDDSQADAHILSQYHFVTDRQGVIFMNFIGKFENLREDFAKVAGRLDISDRELPHKNSSKKSKKKHYSEYYSESTKAKVAQRYAKDIKIFNYQFTA
ncbi:sulfotransferase family 2 domain-containing protein [Waterburya agarophytonicola K14]|uniref:Sulfotransferase family 2 domain-containing protein n=1 Tax=Waterburya agarophytonicola KI4 TaxID=2874699 RepID=A0A964BQD1_9CYAN|nr:sulfotransferase family protein [Waterburya agarophytonicola]MCC0176871.1 sulfotransferase family 2 domain-containing protein [Waterburya agarophytonicola KI4]